MILSAYSVIMGILWFCFFIIIGTVLRRRNWFIASFSLIPILLVMVAGVIRLFCAFEFPFTKVITNSTWFPAFQNFISAPVGSSGISILMVILVVWIAGIIISLVNTIGYYIMFTQCTGKYTRITDSKILQVLERTVAMKKPGANVSLKTDPSEISPYIAGFFKQTIYLPDMDFSEEELENIFLHELSHYVAHDLWIKLLVQIMCAMFWWLPPTRVFKADIDQTLEMKCDIAIVGDKSKVERERYCQSILKVISRAKEIKMTKATPLSAKLFSNKGNKRISQRFNVVLGYKGNRTSVWKSTIVSAVIVIVMFFASYLFVIQPAYAPPPDMGEDVGAFFEGDSETSYLVDNGDGTYSFFVNGEYKFSTSDITVEPYASLPIK